jgi:hypothetical protein
MSPHFEGLFLNRITALWRDGMCLLNGTRRVLFDYGCWSSSSARFCAPNTGLNKLVNSSCLLESSLVWTLSHKINGMGPVHPQMDSAWIHRNSKPFRIIEALVLLHVSSLEAIQVAYRRRIQRKFHDPEVSGSPTWRTSTSNLGYTVIQKVGCSPKDTFCYGDSTHVATHSKLGGKYFPRARGERLNFIRKWINA